MNTKRLAAILLAVLFCLFTVTAHAQYFQRQTLDNITGGPLPVAKGGTGTTSTTNAINALLPSQTGQSSKFLQTNGSATEWASLPVTDGNLVMINVQTISGVTVNNNSNDDGAAIDTYIEADSARKANKVYYFPAGEYHFTATSLFLDGLTNVRFECEPGAKIIKKSGSPEGYIMAFRSYYNITIRGCQFFGTTTATDANNFGEQGVLFSSGTGARFYDNEVSDIGDAAVRSNTSQAISGNTVATYDTWIVNNKFTNVSQVTTTSTGAVTGGVAPGGTDGIHIIGNHFYNLKGSVKICSRSPVTGAFVQGNLINNATSVATSSGIELCSYKNVEIVGNIVKNSQNWGLNGYTTAETGLNKFDWGQYTIRDNQFIDVHRGIRLSNDAYPGDTLQSDTSGISIIGNKIIRPFATSGTSGISWVNGPFRGSVMSLNVVVDKQGGASYWTVPGSGVLNVNNIEN